MFLEFTYLFVWVYAAVMTVFVLGGIIFLGARLVLIKCQEKTIDTDRVANQALQLLKRNGGELTVQDIASRIWDGLPWTNIERLAYQRVVSRVLNELADLNYLKKVERGDWLSDTYRWPC